MSHDNMTASAAQTVVDPVCGMTIDPADAAGHADYARRTLGFCSVSCLERFKADPARFISEAAVSPNQPLAPGSDAVEYTCAMHPEVGQIGPGTCPKCGMALKPRTITAPEEGDENPELVDMNRRFWVSVVLTVPLILIAMVHDLPGNPLAHLASPAALRWAELPLATPVVLHRGVRTMLFPSEDHRDSGGAEPRAGLYWHRSKEFMAASKPREYDVVVERDAEGFYVASVPALPGCHTQARSLDELMERIKEAIELWLEVEGDVGSGLDFVGVQRIRLAS